LAEIVAGLEQAAVAAHAAGERPGRFFLRHWTALGRVTKAGPETYNRVVGRLRYLMADVRAAIGDGDGDGDGFHMALGVARKRIIEVYQSARESTGRRQRFEQQRPGNRRETRGIGR